MKFLIYGVDVHQGLFNLHFRPFESLEAALEFGTEWFEGVDREWTVVVKPGSWIDES